MAHAREIVVVERPMTEVFAFLADGLNNPKWRPDVVSISLSSGEGATVGALYEQTMKGAGGRTIRGDYKIVRIDYPTQLDFAVMAGPARPTGTFSLREITATSTEVVFALELVPHGLMKLISGVIQKQVTKEAEAIHRLPLAMGS